MKSVKSPAVPEVSEHFSDFSGKKLGSAQPEALLKMEFSYGSKYDGATLRLDLGDSEAEEVIDFLAQKLSPKTRRHMVKILGKSEKNYEECMAARDWQGCEFEFGNTELYRRLLQKEDRHSVGQAKAQPLKSHSPALPQSPA
jgi:hypothetical protein